MSTKILSVGGSIVAPEYPDTEFVKEFVKMIKDYLSNNKDDKLILVIGGGGPARIYQKAFREVAEISETSEVDAADWIGIMATRLNAHLLKAACGSLCQNDVVYNPTVDIDFKGRILVAAGWKPGFSTDTDAVFLAEQFNAKVVVNLSNIQQVYTDDPKKNPDAKPLDKITWKDFRKMVGDEWTPGKNCPFDPIASKKAESADIDVICAGGKDISNIEKILNDEKFFGTKISNNL